MLYLSLFPGSYYESICTIAKLYFHWLTSPCRRTDTPLHLAANIDEQKKRKQKYTSLFLKHLQTDFLKFVFLRARSDLRSKTSSSRFESDC